MVLRRDGYISYQYAAVCDIVRPKSGLKHLEQRQVARVVVLSALLFISTMATPAQMQVIAHIDHDSET